MPCRLQIAFSFTKYGDTLFIYAPSEMMRVIKEQSARLGFGVDRLTWKAFRAGHATHLAARGSHISEIMQVGGWKSKAFLAYCDPDTIDAVVFFNAGLDASDNEGDD